MTIRTDLQNVLLSLFVKSGGVLESWEDLQLMQFFATNPLVHDNDRDLYFHSLRWASEDEIDHSINFNSINSCIIEAREWYSAVSFLSLFLFIIQCGQTTLSRHTVHDCHGQHSDFMRIFFISTERPSAYFSFPKTSTRIAR